jgi:hypothetical protein
MTMFSKTIYNFKFTGLFVLSSNTTMVAKFQVSSDFFQNSTIMFTWNNLGTICDSNVGMIKTLVINETHKKNIFPFSKIFADFGKFSKFSNHT